MLLQQKACHKNSDSEICCLCSFFLDLHPDLQKLSLIFHMENLFMCPTPRYLEECLTTIKELHMAQSENFQKLCTYVTYENSGVFFLEITLNLLPWARNHVISASQSLPYFFGTFADIVIKLTILKIVSKNNHWATYADWCKVDPIKKFNSKLILKDG